MYWVFFFSCWQNILEQFIKDAIAQNENSFMDPIEFGAAKCGVEMKMKSAKKWSFAQILNN